MGSIGSVSSPVVRFHEELWRYISKLGDCMKFPLIITRDFNQILDDSEKVGGSSSWRNRANLLREVGNCDLIDLSFFGQDSLGPTLGKGILILIL